MDATSMVQELREDSKREATVQELAKMRESLPGLAQALWDSPGALEALKEEVEAIYPHLSQPEEVTAPAVNRVCNAMSLLQLLASDQETKVLFLEAQLHLLVYPFLSTSDKERPFEYLRLTALGVIGALLRANSGSVKSLLETDLLRLCLNSLEGQASELSKTVAAFILQQLLLDDHGLHFICSSKASLSKVTDALAAVVEALVQAPSIRLLKPVVRCYLRLTEDPRGKRRVKEFLPEGLRSEPSLKQLPASISQSLKEDPVTKKWLCQLLTNLDSETALGV
ncbi:Cell differentiation protein RCD1-like [Symbiodinium microadriaticum]|uniref:Cell differentiation protein RCD1-like n=1 Tax=Symbiodinium microadriaticum TaxID=2951 RepID=A0A1Q9EZT3_SYMMI|nr:Cell differentiation protein RCD1-like [Symbiodinium microadriaticum]CAE7813149.1 Cnot9 [Symbiodinium microadriaticum]CAE7853785.1 Cnot9 [Symbiodinium sp. KB8]